MAVVGILGRGLAAIALGVLAGCASGTGGVGAALSSALAGGGADGAEAAPAPAPPPRPTRAQIDAAGLAMIRTRLTRENIRPLLTAASVNNGVVTYMSQARQSLGLRGSLVVSSRGLGTDLLTVEVSVPGDPAITPRPLADWPESVSRVYRFPGGSPAGQAAPVTCTWVPGDPESVEIIEIVHTGIQVAETCTGTDTAGTPLSFVNYHLVDPADGQIWRSIQWLGPRQGAIDVEVVEPFTG